MALELAAQPVGEKFSEAEISEMKQTIGLANLWGHAAAGLVVGGSFAALIISAYAWVV